MNKRHQIKHRINKRRNRNQKTPALFRFIYRMTMFGMIALVAALGYGISMKQGFVNQEDLLRIGTWFPFEKWFSLEDETVSSNLSYSLLKDHYYATGGNQAVSIQNGVVKNITKKDDQYQVEIQHDNGVKATYGNLQAVAIKEAERIQKGDTLGVFQENVYLRFEKDGKEINLEQAVKV